MMKEGLTLFAIFLMGELVGKAAYFWTKDAFWNGFECGSVLFQIMAVIFIIPVVKKGVK